MVAVLNRKHTIDIPCIQCGAIDHGWNMHKHFLKGRCKCCGSNGHRLLRATINDHGQTISEFSCPVAVVTEIDATQQFLLDYLKYRPCAMKFAEYYAYDPSQIDSALRDFILYGIGGHLPPPYPTTFINEVTRIYEDERATWTFKRASINTDSSEDDEENSGL